MSSRGIGKVGMLVLSTVLGAVATYAIWRLESKPPITSSQVSGTVIDSATNRLIPGAMVKLSGQSFSGSQETDSLGSFGFTIEQVNPGSQATLEIVASGFNTLRLNRTLAELSQGANENVLTRTPPSPANVGAMIGARAAVNLGPIADQNLRHRADLVRIVKR